MTTGSWPARVMMTGSASLTTESRTSAYRARDSEYDIVLMIALSGQLVQHPVQPRYPVSPVRRKVGLTRSAGGAGDRAQAPEHHEDDHGEHDGGDEPPPPVRLVRVPPRDCRLHLGADVGGGGQDEGGQ